MPNWCENILEVYGPSADVTRFMDAAKADVETTVAYGPDAGKQITEHLPLSLNALYPMPKELEATIGDSGSMPGWYEWRVNNWGTKWDLSPSTTVEEGEGGKGKHHVTYEFDSAWAPPVEWLAKVAADFPSLSFKLTYEEPMMAFGGVSGFYGGEEVESVEWESRPFTHDVSEYEEIQ